jgi:hypothetical protein
MKHETDFAVKPSGAAIRYVSIAICTLFLGGCFGGGPKRSAASAATDAYAHRLHNRFYEAWHQPASVGARRGKIVIPVDIEIDKSGRVTDFRMAQGSGYPKVDASIGTIASDVVAAGLTDWRQRPAQWNLRRSLCATAITI